MQNKYQSNRAGKYSYEKRGTTADDFSMSGRLSTSLWQGAVGPCKLKIIMAQRPLLSLPPFIGTLDLGGACAFSAGAIRRYVSYVVGVGYVSYRYGNEWLTTQVRHRESKTRGARSGRTVGGVIDSPIIMIVHKNITSWTYSYSYS